MIFLISNGFETTAHIISRISEIENADYVTTVDEMLDMEFLQASAKELSEDVPFEIEGESPRLVPDPPGIKRGRLKPYLPFRLLIFGSRAGRACPRHEALDTESELASCEGILAGLVFTPHLPRAVPEPERYEVPLTAGSIPAGFD